MGHKTMKKSVRRSLWITGFAILLLALWATQPEQCYEVNHRYCVE